MPEWETNPCHTCTSCPNHSILSRVLNSLLEALNEKPHLPRYIIVVIDRDWLHHSKFVDFGAGGAITTAIQWWLWEFNRNIDSRKDQLHRKRPGALSMHSEPRFIWVTMLKWPYIHDSFLSAVYALTWKFNKNLERVIAGDWHSLILKPEIPMNNAEFDIWGNLTARGRVSYWNHLDQVIRDFDHGKLELTGSAHLTSRHSTRKHKLAKNTIKFYEIKINLV